MLKVIWKIFLNSLPVILMIILIPFIKNDYYLALTYVLIIVVSFILHYQKRDIIFLVFGFVALFLSEYFFIKTGVETFNRQSLFNIMPIWLPVLWAYAFVAIKRSVIILNNYLD